MPEFIIIFLVLALLCSLLIIIPVWRKERRLERAKASRPFDLKSGDTITLIPSDFDIVVNDNGMVTMIHNYSNPINCPVARCLKRMGYSVLSLDPFIDGIQVSPVGVRVSVNGEFISLNNLGVKEISNAAQAIHDGAESYTITL